MMRWIASWWEWLRDVLRNEDDEAYPSYHDYLDETKSPEWIARRKRWVREWFEMHELFERGPSYLRAGRLRATALVIGQLRDSHATERVQRLIAESEDQ